MGAKDRHPAIEKCLYVAPKVRTTGLPSALNRQHFQVMCKDMPSVGGQYFSGRREKLVQMQLDLVEARLDSGLL